jgi:hypothetical protein
VPPPPAGQASASVTSADGRYSFSRRLSVPTAQGGHGCLVPVQPDSTLMMWVIWRLVDDPDSGVQSHALDLLRMLLETDSPAVGHQCHLPPP